MTRPNVVIVDERDSSWENEIPRFRVYLCDPVPVETVDITGADILQVIDWAQRRAGTSMTYAIALVYDDAHNEQEAPGTGRGLVWLVGNDPAYDAAKGPGSDPRARMLARRDHSVGIPKADRWPAPRS